MPSSATTMIVFALESEARELFSDFNTTFCGVGKVNAAYHLTKALMAWKNKHGSFPTCVINAGSAGSSVFPRHSLVNCTRFIQRDMDATALNFAPYQTPLEETPIVLDNGLRVAAFPEGICGTGDNFETTGMMHEWNVVDMESYALAKVCRMENIPFCCLKYITDGADAASPSTWEETLEDAAHALHKAIVNYSA